VVVEVQPPAAPGPDRVQQECEDVWRRLQPVWRLQWGQPLEGQMVAATPWWGSTRGWRAWDWAAGHVPLWLGSSSWLASL